MRGQRHLEPAAERGPVQRRDNRLRGVLDRVEDVGQIGRGVRLAEFGDVGAGDEGAPRADDDDRLDGGVPLRRLDAPLEAVADDLRQRVDRRGIDRDGSDLAVDGQFGNGIDGRHDMSSLKNPRPMLMLIGSAAQEAGASTRL